MDKDDAFESMANSITIILIVVERLPDGPDKEKIRKAAMRLKQMFKKLEELKVVKQGGTYGIL